MEHITWTVTSCLAVTPPDLEECLLEWTGLADR